MVRVAAVDVEKNRELASQLQSAYNFQIKGVPTIIVLKPKVRRGPERVRLEKCCCGCCCCYCGLAFGGWDVLLLLLLLFGWLCACFSLLQCLCGVLTAAD
jgi:hypothetical protein